MYALSFFVIVRLFGWRTAAVVALFRVGLTLTNFALGPLDARILDDVTYAQRAQELLAGGIGPWDVLSDADARDALFSRAGSRHVGFYFLNLAAQTAFGPYYSSGVLLNVVLSLIGARAVHGLALAFGEAPARARRITLFFLFHWDVLAWASFFNLKDTAVLTLAAWTLLWFLRTCEKPSALRLGLTLLPLSVLTVFRWYVSALLIASFAAYGLLALRGWARVALLAGSALGAAVVLQTTIRFGLIHPAGLPGGAVRFFLTPQPWSVADHYGFLLVPATLHWLFAPLTLLGAVGLWTRLPRARLVLLWFALVLAFYAMVPLLQGPRHRYQTAFVLALMQFEGLRILCTQALGRPRPRSQPQGELACAA